MSYLIKFFVLAVVSFAFILVLARSATWLLSFHQIKTFDTVQPARVAIIFGAGLRRDGTPTEVLRDRIAAGVRLYQAKRVEKLLMSGDNRFIEYNEPAAMKAYALSLGVPEEDIVLDFAGRRTYDTCYRAKAIFGVDRAILVTQRFHLPRALLTCNRLGLQVEGVPADLQAYHPGSQRFWEIREIPASLIAILDVTILHPKPVLGEAEPIFPAHD